MGDTDAIVEEILAGYDTITVVGASADTAKAAHRVPAVMQRHGWRIVPVNPRGGLILGEPAHPTLASIGSPVGLVDVFRPSAQAPDVARQAVAAGATALWLQLGIASDEARVIAEGPACSTCRTGACRSSGDDSGLTRPRPDGPKDGTSSDAPPRQPGLRTR